jgi:putative oxidoreductase
MKKQYLTKNNDTLLNVSFLLLRLTVGGILFVVGAGKVFGWFGGYGLTQTLQFYVTSGISIPLAYTSIYTEFLGGLLLIFGLLTRPAAFAVSINMLVAAIIIMPQGFLTGAAYPFTLMVIAIVILIVGPLSYSLDSRIVSRGGMRHDVGGMQ